MEEVLNTQQVRPGEATQFMHSIFSSDDEMLTFYLTLNRFINPSSYLVERTDQKRLDDLASVLYSNVPAFDAVCNSKYISVKEVVKGFGALMMNTQISNAKRLNNADSVGLLMDYIMNTIKSSWQFKKMNHINHIHLENIEYLRKKLKVAVGEEMDSEGVI